MIDFDRGEEVPTQAAVERLVEWTAPAREALGLEVALPEPNGAQARPRGRSTGAPRSRRSTGRRSRRRSAPMLRKRVSTK